MTHTTTGSPIRFLRASLLAPLPATVLVVVICMVMITRVIDGYDNARLDAFFMTALASPLIYLLTVMATYLVTRLLSHFGILQKKTLITTAALAATVFALGCAEVMPLDKLHIDHVTAYAGFDILLTALLIPTALLWLRLASTSSGLGTQEEQL